MDLAGYLTKVVLRMVGPRNCFPVRTLEVPKRSETLTPSTSLKRFLLNLLDDTLFLMMIYIGKGEKSVEVIFKLRKPKFWEIKLLRI